MLLLSINKYINLFAQSMREPELSLETQVPANPFSNQIALGMKNK